MRPSRWISLTWRSLWKLKKRFLLYTQPEGDEGDENEDEEKDEEDEVKKPREVQPRGDDMLSRLQNTQKKQWSGNFS